ncbi:MAG TPA: hypothetical protein VKA30_11360 [Actinomycetota bacterium]|nr:hypothetical protein [Actinomycetota bacterium]
MSDHSTDRLTALKEKSRATGLSEEEARELADLERGGPAPVTSKLLPPRIQGRPWQAQFWRQRSLGPLGGLLLVFLGAVLVVVAAVTRKPAVDWRIYEDPAFTFAIDYPSGWTSTSISNRSRQLTGPKARRVDGVVFSQTQIAPRDLAALINVDYRGPAYGIAVYNPGTLLPPVGVPSASPGAVRIGGLDAQEYTTTTDGVTLTVAMAQVGKRLVVFFWKAPDEAADGLHDVFDHARDSLRLSEGLAQTPGAPTPTTGIKPRG